MRYKPWAIKDGHKGYTEDNHGQGKAKIELYKAHPVGISKPWCRKKGNGAGLGGHNGQANIIPRQFPIAYDVTINIFYPSAFVHAINDNKQ